MNTKKYTVLFAIVIMFFLSGCVTPPYYGATSSYGVGGYYGGARSSFRYQPSYYRVQSFIGGHRHFRGGRHIGGHRGHRSHNAIHRGGGRHFGNHRGGGHRSSHGGHRGGGHRGHR